jgi:hypothetical protein
MMKKERTRSLLPMMTSQESTQISKDFRNLNTDLS